MDRIKTLCCECYFLAELLYKYYFSDPIHVEGLYEIYREYRNLYDKLGKTKLIKVRSRLTDIYIKRSAIITDIKVLNTPLYIELFNKHQQLENIISRKLNKNIFYKYNE